MTTVWHRSFLEMLSHLKIVIRFLGLKNENWHCWSSFSKQLVQSTPTPSVIGLNKWWCVIRSVSIWSVSKKSMSSITWTTLPILPNLDESRIPNFLTVLVWAVGQYADCGNVGLTEKTLLMSVFPFHNFQFTSSSNIVETTYNLPTLFGNNEKSFLLVSSA